MFGKIWTYHVPTKPYNQHGMVALLYSCTLQSVKIKRVKMFD